MNNLVFTTLVATGFGVAFLHAAIPTHWLPFVVAAHAQNWNKTKTLTITGLAGAGHVLLTTALGILIAWGGIAINTKLSGTFPLIAGGALIAVGLFYFWRQLSSGHGHTHLFSGHSHHSHSHDDSHRLHEHEKNDQELESIEKEWSHRRSSDWQVIVALLALLTFSPCEAFLPVFLVGAKYGWIGFALLSATLALATVSGMLVFTWITFSGLQRLQFKSVAKYESIVVGIVFCLLGAMVILLEH